MPRRTRLATVLALGLAALGLAGRARAGMVESVLEVGSTFAVAGEPSNGGVSIGLSFLWPVEERFRIGVMGFADELGNATTRLTGPGGVDLGPASAGERYTWGGGLRLEGHARSSHTVDPFMLMTWGAYQVHDDLHGTSVNTDLAAGLGLGAGVQRVINGEHALGLVVRGQWLSRGEASRYMSAALEWRWAWKGAGATPAGTTK
jgi:hypothetical protein